MIFVGSRVSIHQSLTSSNMGKIVAKNYYKNKELYLELSSQLNRFAIFSRKIEFWVIILFVEYFWMKALRCRTTLNLIYIFALICGYVSVWRYHFLSACFPTILNLSILSTLFFTRILSQKSRRKSYTYPFHQESFSSIYASPILFCQNCNHTNTITIWPIWCNTTLGFIKEIPNYH